MFKSTSILNNYNLLKFLPMVHMLEQRVFVQLLVEF